MRMWYISIVNIVILWPWIGGVHLSYGLVFIGHMELFVITRTNLIPSNSLIALAEATVDHFVKRSWRLEM